VKNWPKKIPPYEGEEPYIYLAFARADAARVWSLAKPLLQRGCRVWYAAGSAGSAEELLRRQKRAAGAGLTVLYLTDAACSDQDLKSAVLVNQKYARPILCLDPDGADRRLAMNLREDIPHVALYQLSGAAARESAVLHADGFSADMLGEPVHVGGDLVGKLTGLFCLLAAALALVSFAGSRYFGWFRPEIEDEVVFTDPVILSAVRRAALGGSITEELTGELTALRLEGLPESWEELSLLPALERVALPQTALLGEAELPEGLVIELTGGGADE